LWAACGGVEVWLVWKEGEGSHEPRLVHLPVQVGQLWSQPWHPPVQVAPLCLPSHLPVQAARFWSLPVQAPLFWSLPLHLPSQVVLLWSLPLLLPLEVERIWNQHLHLPASRGCLWAACGGVGVWLVWTEGEGLHELQLVNLPLPQLSLVVERLTFWLQSSLLFCCLLLQEAPLQQPLSPLWLEELQLLALLSLRCW